MGGWLVGLLLPRGFLSHSLALSFVSDGGGKADREERQTDCDGWIDWQALCDVAHKQAARQALD